MKSAKPHSSESPESPDSAGYTLLQISDQPPFNNLTFSEILNGVKVISKASLTTTLSLFYMFSINFVSLAYISSLENSAMTGGIGLGFVCSNGCGYILMTSIDQGVNALAAQAFGAEKYGMVGRNYHRGLFCITVILVPVMIFFLFTKPMLMSFGIDANVAQYTWDYIRYAYPSFLFYGFFDCTKSYLYAQKIFNPILYIQTITTFSHLFWGWLFISKLEMGPAGAGIAKDIYEFSNMVGIIVYMYQKDNLKGWIPYHQIEWLKKVLVWREFKTFLLVTLSMAGLLFLDMVCYEIFIILAGHFGQDQLSVHSAIANSGAVYYSIPFGISVAIMTYVGAAIGHGEPNTAKNYTYFGLLVHLLVTAVFSTLLWFLREYWAALFSPNETVKMLLLDFLNLFLTFIFFDGIQVVLSGTIKGIGKQNSATIGLIITYYFIALPLIWYMAIKLDWKVKGVWGGFLIGIVVLLGFYLVILASTDFEAQIAKIKSIMKRKKDV